jgi:hypothetical protein
VPFLAWRYLQAGRVLPFALQGGMMGRVGRQAGMQMSVGQRAWYLCGMMVPMEEWHVSEGWCHWQGAPTWLRCLRRVCWQHGLRQWSW